MNSLKYSKTLLSSLLAFALVSFTSMAAEPLKVVIIAPTSYLSESYDTPLIQAHLEGMLQGITNGADSSVTLLTGSSLRNTLLDVYHATRYEVFEGSYSSWETTQGYDDMQHLENNDYDVAVLVNNNEYLQDHGVTGSFEGTALLSKRLLAKGTDVYLLEPELTSTTSMSTKEKIHRMANGCGIHVIPAGEAVRQANASNLLSDDVYEDVYEDRIVNTEELLEVGWDLWEPVWGPVVVGSELVESEKSYLMAATIFSSLTDLGSASGTSYSPFSVTLESQLEQVAEDAILDSETSTHYTGSFNGQGMVQHRPIDVTAPFYNNTIKYGWVGTSTESGINTSLVQLIGHYYRVDGTTSITYANEKITSTPNVLDELANKDTFLFIYSRDTYDYLFASLSNQSNLVPTIFGRQAYIGDSAYQNGGQATTYAHSIGSQNMFEYAQASNFENQGAIINPSYMMYGRAYEQFTDVPHLYDNHHQTQEGSDMIAAGMLAANVGIDFDADDMNRFHHYREGDPYYLGWNTVMQLAYLSEDRKHIPDSNLRVTTDSLPAASAASPLNVQLQATEGTAPYSWEETTGRIPAGITLTKEGKLLGNATGAGGSYNLVFKVTDVNGAIRKQALELNTAGSNLDEQIYGWNSRYYFNSLAEPNFIEGTVVTALNGGNSNVTVNGVTFQGTNLGGGYKAAYTGGISSTGNTGYNNLLSTMSEATSNEVEIPLTGLTAGTTYSLQVFYNNKNDADGFAAQMHLDIDGDGPGEVVLKASHTEQANTDYGSYVVANFIAHASDLTLSIKARSDSYSIKGKAAFSALLLTEPATVARHTGDTKHAEITWDTPMAVTGLDDLIEGLPVKALNGGSSDLSLNGINFEATNIGTTSNVADEATDAIDNPTFAQLMTEQTRTRYYHPLILKDLEIGKTYQVQIFNAARTFNLVYKQGLKITDPTLRSYQGSDTYFGLPKHGDVNIHEFGEVLSSVGTFTATSTEQLIEMNVNEHNNIKDISFSAVYLVEVDTPIDYITDNGTNQAPTLAEESGSNVTVVNILSDISSTIATFVGSDPDIGDAQIYSISGGNENNSFWINSATGELYYINQLTGLTTGEFTLEIMVSDNKIPAKSATLEHTIQIELSDDTDNDGFSDGYEQLHGTSIFDNTSKPFLVGYWDFNDPTDTNTVGGNLGSPDGEIMNGASYTPNQGGFSGQTGDYAMNMGTGSSEHVLISDIDNLNAALADRTLTVSFWQKITTVSNSFSFYMAGEEDSRIISTHAPWSNEIIYLDAFDARTTYDSSGYDWASWSHYAYVAHADSIEIWRNGVLLSSLSTANPAETIEYMSIGGSSGKSGIKGVIDDFAIFNEALTQTQLQALANGASPMDFIDGDSDRIVDMWEQTNFGDLTTADDTTDTDGDGQGDYEEYIAGTTPTSASSLLKIDTINVAGNNGALRWKGKRNRVYQILHSVDLSEWTLLDGEFSVEADDEQIIIDLNSDDSNTMLPKGFYRIKIKE